MSIKEEAEAKAREIAHEHEVKWCRDGEPDHTFACNELTVEMAQALIAAHDAAVEKAIEIAKKKQQDFLSEQYAVGQPLSSVCERIGVGVVIDALRALSSR